MDSTKHIVITGVSRGIGHALAERYTELGYRVAGCSRADACDVALEVYETCDITDYAQVEAFVDRVRTVMGTVDILVHNAGVLGPRARLQDVELDAWRSTIDVNLTGSFHVLRGFWDLLEAAEHPVVALISSSVGRKGRGEWGPYSASKHGVEALVDIVSDELAKAKVVSINPGGTATEMRSEAYPDEDPTTIPSAQTVAEVIREILESPEPRRRYDVRALLD